MTSDHSMKRTRRTNSMIGLSILLATHSEWAKDMQPKQGDESK